MLPAESTNVDRNRRSDCETLNAVKVERDEELYTRHVYYGAGIENPVNASRSEPTNKGDYHSPPLNIVKVEPTEEPVSPTESNLYYGASASYVINASDRESVTRYENSNKSRDREVSNPEVLAEQATETLLCNSSPTVGYLVYVENPRNGILASSYQPVSNELSSKSSRSEYWLPILSRLEHWPCIKDEFLSAVERICTEIHFYRSEPEAVFKVCASLMNSAVVKIMGNGRNELDSSAFINGFFSIYRILKQYAQDEEKLIELSNRALTDFMSSTEDRVKKAVPNLGEFLMHLTVSTQWTWQQISNVFMAESDTRSVFWYCVGNYTHPAAYPELVNVHQYQSDREAKVFHATTVSRNLVMFQVKFANMTKSLEFTEFCTNFGRVHDILTAKLKKLYDTVVAVKNWDQFYDFLQIPRVSLARRNSDLVQAVMRSATQGYHGRFAPRGYHNRSAVQGYHKRPASAMAAGSSKQRRIQ